jgi:transposase-like protein
MTKKIPLPEKQDLVNLYSQYGTTISSLARHYGTTQPTVRSWLKFYGIERKDHQQASTEANNRDRLSKTPTKEILETLYSQMSLYDLESYYSVGQATIYEWLKQHNIPTKTLSDACKQGKARLWDCGNSKWIWKK